MEITEQRPWKAKCALSTAKEETKLLYCIFDDSNQAECLSLADSREVKYMLNLRL